MADILQAARSYYGLADTESCTTQLFTNQAGQTCVAFEIPLSNEDFAVIVQRMQNMQQPDTQPDTAIIEGPTVKAMRESYNALSKAERGRYGSFARYMAESSTGIIDVYTGEPYAAPKTEDYPALQAHLDSIVEESKNRPRLENPDALTGDGCSGFERRTGLMVRTDGSVYEWDGKSNMQPGGPAERHVVHVDAPEEPEPVSMDAVWLDEEEATQAQKQFAIDYCENDGYYVQWAMLTEEQKQKADKRYVHLRGSECSDAQKEGALGYDDETYTFAIPWWLLTDEQKQKAKEAKP